MQKPPVDFSDPIYDLYWKNLSNQNGNTYFRRVLKTKINSCFI